MIAERTSPFVAGRFVDGGAGAIDVVNPADETVVASVGSASPEQVDAALEAAARAQEQWARTSLRERMDVLLRVSAAIDAQAESLARLVVAEVGKPIREARGEVGAAARFFAYFAHLLESVTDEIVPSVAPAQEIWIRRVPHGVVVAIIPWNYPAALVSRKVAPALAAGNAVVLKPHEQTPLSGLFLAQLFVENGIPEGLVSVVPGRGATVGQQLVAHPLTSLVTMTGSVAAGRAILRSAADRITPVSLELGGKAPLIVLEDADVARAAAATVESRFANCGQVCICAERVYVHEHVYDDFVSELSQRVDALRVGDPLDDATELGPKVTREERDKVEAMLAEAVDAGARVLKGGGRPDGAAYAKGWWLEPTIVADVDDSMPIMQREIFGPVVPLATFSGEADAVARANASPYGLSAYVFTNDFRRVMRFVNELRFGEVYVNRVGPEDVAGFHAGFRQSGLGGDDGPHGLDFYWQRQTVYVDWSE